MDAQITRATDDVLLLSLRVKRLQRELKQAAAELTAAITRLESIDASLGMGPR
jgi:hypothetical protein